MSPALIVMITMIIAYYFDHPDHHSNHKKIVTCLVWGRPSWFGHTPFELATNTGRPDDHDHDHDNDDNGDVDNDDDDDDDNDYDGDDDDNDDDDNDFIRACHQYGSSW